MNLKTPEIVDEIAVRMELVNACAAVGGKEFFAHLHRFSPDYLDSIIRGERSPGHSLLTALGYSKVTRYVKRAPKTSSVSSPGACLPGVGNSPASVGAFSSS